MAEETGVELLRKCWEIEDHWVLRRDFMTVHKDKFSPDRLLCLAQVFVNIETLGVQYDEEIMNENSELAEEVPSLSEFRRKKMQLQSEERFKAPPRAAKNRNEVGTRNVTHDRYQNHQQNYSQGRQDYNQYQQMHGYGKVQNQPNAGHAYGRGYNAQPLPQHRYGDNYPHQQQRQQYQPQQQRQYQPQQQQHQPQPQHQQYQMPAYGRHAVPPAGHQQQSHSGGGYGQRQEYGRGAGGRGGQSGGSTASGSSYQNLLTRNYRR